MEQVLIIITALIFYALGRYAGREAEITKKASKQIKKKLSPPHVGVIEYPTQTEADYTGSEQEKIDKQQEELARKAGLIK